jgi:hypothetical protein
MTNPDGPAKQLYDLLHQYVPSGSLERAVWCLLKVSEGAPGNEVGWLNRAWVDATGCETPADVRRYIAQLERRGHADDGETQ